MDLMNQNGARDAYRYFQEVASMRYVIQSYGEQVNSIQYIAQLRQKHVTHDLEVDLYFLHV